MPAALHEILEEANLSGTLTNDYVFFGGKRIARRNDGSYLSSATIQNASLSQANAWDSCGSNCNFGPIPSWTSSGSGPTDRFTPISVGTIAATVTAAAIRDAVTYPATAFPDRGR